MGETLEGHQSDRTENKEIMTKIELFTLDSGDPDNLEQEEIELELRKTSADAPWKAYVKGEPDSAGFSGYIIHSDNHILPTDRQGASNLQRSQLYCSPGVRELLIKSKSYWKLG